MQHDGSWKSDENGYVFTAYQTKEGDYHGRSFEDTFFSLNKELLNLGADRFDSLTETWLKKYVNDDDCSALDFANKAVKSKPSLAIEILLNSEDDEEGNPYSNWKTPAYIEEGLKWLRGDFDA